MKRMIYRAMSGDTWDKIAHDLYGDENKALELMRENPTKCLVTVFSGGEKVLLPIGIKVTYGKMQEDDSIYQPAHAPWKEQA